MVHQGAINAFLYNVLAMHDEQNSLQKSCGRACIVCIIKWYF